MRYNKQLARPSPEQLRREVRRIRRNRRKRRESLNWLLALLTAFVCIGAVATYCPPLRVHGSSMAPTLNNGNVALVVRPAVYARGDVVLAECNDRMLIKRIIGAPGDALSIQKDGTVEINGKAYPEPYIGETGAAGRMTTGDKEFTCTVPEGAYFLMGDNRTVSVDSRNSQIGYFGAKQLKGKLAIKIWPLTEAGFVNGGTNRRQNK